MIFSSLFLGFSSWKNSCSAQQMLFHCEYMKLMGELLNYVNYKNCKMRGSPSYLLMLLLVMVSFVLFKSLTYAFWARKKYNATQKISYVLYFM